MKRIVYFFILAIYPLFICEAREPAKTLEDLSKISYTVLEFKSKPKIKATLDIAKKPLELLPVEYGGRGYSALKLPEFASSYKVHLESILADKWNMTSNKILLPRLIFLDKDFKVIKMTQPEEIDGYDVPIPENFRYNFTIKDANLKYLVITSDDYRMKEKCDFQTLAQGQSMFKRIIVAWFGKIKLTLEK